MVQKSSNRLKMATSILNWLLNNFIVYAYATFYSFSKTCTKKIVH